MGRNETMLKWLEAVFRLPCGNLNMRKQLGKHLRALLNVESSEKRLAVNEEAVSWMETYLIYVLR